MSNIIESLSWRYATKKFDTNKKLSEDKINILYNSIINHPNYTSDHYLRYRAYTNFDPSKHLSLPYPQQEVLLNNLLDQKPEWQ